MLRWFRSIDWLEINTSALLLLLTIELLSSFGFPHQGEQKYKTDEAAYSESNELPWYESSAVWTAIFTGLLTVSTIGLWSVTRVAANAARDAAKIAERSLTDLERAYLFFGEVTDPGFAPARDGNSLEIRTGRKYFIINHGKTPAILTEVLERDVRLDWSPNFALPVPIDSSKERGQTLPNGIGVGAGLKHEFVYEFPVMSYIGVIHRSQELFFMGYVRYTDIFKRRHRTGFCLHYDISSESFRAVGGDDYNYTTDED